MEVDCRFCENCRLVDEEFPSANEPILVKRWYECSVTKEVFLTLDELRKAYAKCSHRAPKVGYELPSRILDEVDGINLAISNILRQKVKVIEVKSETMAYIASPCHSRVDFETKVGALATLLEMNISILRKVLDKFGKSYEKDEKSLKLLNRLFSEKNMMTPELSASLSFLEQLVRLRNKLPPYHTPSMEEAREIMKSLGIASPAEAGEWQNNSEILLKKFLNALRELRIALTRLAMM